MNQCKDCRFWVHHDTWEAAGEGEGERRTYESGTCQRHAPLANVRHDKRWPITLSTDGCGDWEAKVASPVLER